LAAAKNWLIKTASEEDCLRLAAAKNWLIKTASEEDCLRLAAAKNWLIKTASEEDCLRLAAFSRFAEPSLLYQISDLIRLENFRPWKSVDRRTFVIQSSQPLGR
jgi:DNA-binding CsgD family transcriptional regulator